MIENRVGRQSDDAEMRALFAAFDKDHNGYIDAKELKQTMAEIGMPVSAADVKQMLREAGVSKKHGRIYYEGQSKVIIIMCCDEFGNISASYSIVVKISVFVYNLENKFIPRFFISRSFE